MNYIERVLREKANEDGCSILVSKWNYDSTLIPEALETIPLIFPHFSKHNKSHSETILNNIINVLGKNVIGQMSSTDLWLILESAYCHDLGMVITADMIREAMDNGSFLNYFRNVVSNPFHEMNKYASYYEVKGDKLVLKQNDFSLMMYDSIRFLLSDFFRSRHADNSLSAIMNTDSVLALDLPKAIVPSRLINMMGAVCRSHTLSFNDVMQLPQAENGIATDMAHPRFVACLLRLGDILDIDNNRFSDVFLKTISEMPEQSQLHKEKHLSISHLRIDNKYIEVKAKCKSPRVAKVTKDWFSWIKEEVNNQTLRWNTIVPDDISCYLPTINYLDIEIEGYDNLSTIEMPQFTIDVNKALELLQGKNFYKDPFDAIRELLQNAVDSTLLKFYKLYQGTEVVNQGITENFLEKARTFPIHVEIIRDENNVIQVTISDKGVGISRHQLKYLSNTGSSSKNILKQDIIRKMPIWMQPSGVFGIGFQSVFLLTDKVEIKTKDFFTDECIEIEMYNPQSKMKGDIYIKPCSHIFESGFCIHFSLKGKWNERKVQRYHFDGDIHLEDNISALCDKVRQYGKMSFFPIICNGETIEREKMQYFDEETGIELNFSSSNRNNKQNFYFKNALISSLNNVPFLSFDANFHALKSSDCLTLDRNSLKVEVQDNIRFLLHKSILDYVNSSIFKPVYYDGINSFVLYLRSLGTGKPIPKLEDEWDFVCWGKHVSEYCNYDRIVVRTSFASTVDFIKTEEENELHIVINAILMSQSEPLIRTLLAILSAHYANCYLRRYFVENRFQCVEYVFQNCDVDDNDIGISIPNELDLLKHKGKRIVLPYIRDFRSLMIPVDKAHNFPLDIGVAAMIPPCKVLRIISPFIYEDNVLLDKRNDELYDFVHECNGCPIEEIISDYERFVAVIKATEKALEQIGK